MNRPENIEPAAGGPDNGGFFHRWFGTEVSAEPRIDTAHENGASCMNCTNGIIGNAGTASMRANEY